MKYLLAGFFTLFTAFHAAQPLAWAADAAGEVDKTVAGLVDEPAKYEQLRKEHWAFQPVGDVAPRGGKPDGWARTEIDRYVLAKLAGQELEPSKPADRRTLIRRATFDLTGLPPTPEEVEAFVNDSSGKAFEKVVDRLLALPAFGERWGRHWLDVARYAESTGMSRNIPLYYAWRYRDYVVDSFNADTPFDRFIKEQIAGDLLPAETDARGDMQKIATGFLAVGMKDINEGNPLQFKLNIVDEQIDTTTRAFLGMTVACARCHDHKFDPIPTAEYYSLAGIFRSTEMLAGVIGKRGSNDYYKPELLLPLSGKADDRVAASAAVHRSERLKDEDGQAMSKQERKKEMKLEMRQGLSGEKKIRPVAMGVKDGRIPADSNIFVRGEVGDRGPVVPRGTITLPGMPPLGEIPSDQSGRLELANWLASDKNPLTARVMVNRVWQHLFGQGIVRTVDNFGTTGEAPTHPELLDHLARQFMDDGWSVKQLIRRIMVSGVYQQAATFDEAKYATDPDNRLLWRASPRRLEGEAIRDAMLAAGGNLDRSRPVGSPVMKTPAVDVSRFARLTDRMGTDTPVRSIYLPMLRGVAPNALDVFDLADNSQVTGSRDVTTVAPQALFMMNDPFVQAQAKALAKRVTSERSADLARVDRAYGLALGRVPNDAERKRAIKYVRGFTKQAGENPGKKANNAETDAWASICQALFASAEFRYVN